MGSRAAQPSQVSLFSAQVAEQIQRLRTLTGAGETPTGNELVDLKRAIMATRLLAGSARILQLEPLQVFLDRLLDWLQGIESARHPLSTTQTLLLESVIEVEERLMLHLESNGSTIDLVPFRDELAEMLRLIDRHAAAGPPPQPEPLPAAAEDAAQSAPLEAASGTMPAPEEQSAAAAGRARATAQAPPPHSAANDPLVDALGAVTIHLEGIIHEGSASLSDEAINRLRAFLQRMDGALRCVEPSAAQAAGAPAAAAASAALASASPAAGGVATSDVGWDHPLIAPLRPLLQQQRKALQVPISIAIRETGAAPSPGIRDIVTQVIGHLLEDVCVNFGQSRREGALPDASLSVTLQLAADHGRLLLSIGDNAPAHVEASGIDEADHLALYRGLRQVKALVEQLNGLIWVEPSADAGPRFVLSLPAHLRDQIYRVIDLGQVQVAVPWVLVDDITTTAGLLFHADSTGESFHHHGRPIALADLAEYVASLIPREDPAEQIAIVGSVEKRLGLFCEGVGDFVEASEITAAPKGWERVAYGGLDLGGHCVPLLDIGRLLRLRYSSQDGMGDEAGSLPDVEVETYVPVEQATGPAGGAAQPPNAEQPAVQRCLLINQSEFRRRDLARTLESMGYDVMAVADLVRGLHYLEGRHVELIVTDLRLGERGAENLARLRDGQIDTPVVLTSSVAREFALELARKTGADACWLDPFHPTDLQAALASLAS
jgi:two-component system chemotaxis response regulator CheY